MPLSAALCLEISAIHVFCGDADQPIGEPQNKACCEFLFLREPLWLIPSDRYRLFERGIHDCFHANQGRVAGRAAARDRRDRGRRVVMTARVETLLYK